MTWHQLLATSTEAGKCGWTKRDKTLYALYDAGVKALERWFHYITHRDKTAYAEHDQQAHLSLQSPERGETVYAQTKRDKTLYALYDAGVKALERMTSQRI